jgi:hypothetical protein
MASIIDAITTQWTIYPDGQGHFALGSPDGQALNQGEAVEISLGGFWIPGAITWNHSRDYFTALVDHTVCGLCAGMRVRTLQGASQAADGERGLHQWWQRPGQLQDEEVPR